MKKSIILFFALLGSFSVSAQIQWQKCLGGTVDDNAFSVIQTFDTGYLVAGFAASNNGNVTGNHGGSDFWLIKLNTSGNIQWQKCLGGSYSDGAYSAIQTLDSGYVIAGTSFSNDSDVTGNHGSWDCWVVKLNTSGNIEWQKSLGGTGSDAASSVIQTSDSGYVVAGNSNSNDGDITGNHGSFDYWVVKLNTSGNIEWQKSLGGTGYDAAFSVIQAFDSGYAVAGFSTSNDGDVTGNHGDFDYWVVKLNASGSIEWQKSLGGTLYDGLHAIIQTLDSGYVAIGVSYSINGDVTGNHGLSDDWIVKLNASGNIEWQKSLGGTNDDFASSVFQTYDGGYIVGGASRSSDGDVTANHGSGDYWLIKLNAFGIIEWQKSLGGSANDGSWSIIQTTDSGYVATGFSDSNNGDVTGNHGQRDIWVVKFDTTLTTNLIPSLMELNDITIAPNPASDELYITNPLYDNCEIKVMNTLGETVLGFELQATSYRLNISALPDGIYFLQLTSKGQWYNRKFVVQR